MSSTLFPFLYQTRTLRMSFRASSTLILTRFAHSPRPSQHRTVKKDNSIPFEWDRDGLNLEPEQISTITPSEAEIFKGIFDEIAQGKMAPAKKRSLSSVGGSQDSPNSSTGKGNEMGKSSLKSRGMARSLVEQARVTEFREKFLTRYPTSLRNAAQVALGLYELEPRSSDLDGSRIFELEEADKDKWAERARYDLAKAEELERVESLMKSSETDEALWKVMEKEVFSLPEKLGIIQKQQTKACPKRQASESKVKSTVRRRKKPTALEDGEASRLDTRKKQSTVQKSTKQENVEEEKRIMDIHGPLYSQFISTALGLFDAAFARPSPYAFQILPRIKELGLPSYVLGVSTPFYSKLARMHWDRFGDAHSALNVLQEMSSTGLYADEEVKDLLTNIHDNLHGCTWGAQGPFVMAMMEAPPYDGALTQRLEVMEKAVEQSLNERARSAL